MPCILNGLVFLLHLYELRKMERDKEGFNEGSDDMKEKERALTNKFARNGRMVKVDARRPVHSRMRAARIVSLGPK